MIATHRTGYVDCPLGRILIQSDGQSLTGLFTPQHMSAQLCEPTWPSTDELLTRVREQLDEYFAGQRHRFELPLLLTGTPFQRRVWDELMQIPFGTTITYRQLAERIGQPNASRAVGSANSRNPISIVVPCHRVIGSSGDLTGYAGGIATKQWLIAWEREQLNNRRFTSAETANLQLAMSCHIDSTRRATANG